MSQDNLDLQNAYANYVLQLGLSLFTILRSCLRKGIMYACPKFFLLHDDMMVDFKDARGYQM